MFANNTEKARFNMVEQQIRPWDVVDRQVLDTLQAIPREKFVPEAYAGLAFADIEVPLGHGQSMMPPRVEARMLQALDIKPADRVLEIGTGSGFVTACLARLGKEVVSIDIQPDFTAAAAEKLASLGISNVALETGNALAGSLPKEAFDVVAVTGSLPSYDASLQELLAPGGRMFVICGESPVMEALLVTRTGEDNYRKEGLFETDLTTLEEAPAVEHFVF